MGKLLVLVVLIFAIAGTGYYLFSIKGSNLSIPNLNYSGKPQNSQTTGETIGQIPAGQPGNEITLTVTSPANGSIVNSPDIVVSGKTLANSDVAVNDTDTKAGSDGNFSVNVTLDEGANTIDVVANDQNGGFTEKEITVTYQPPANQ